MGLFDKAKEAAKGYVGEIKDQGSMNKQLAEAPMEERIKMRPEGVRYCLISLGKILDVYDTKVVFSATKSVATMAMGLLQSGSQTTQGEKTIYYKDAIGVQYKAPSITDGYIQVETASGNMTSAHSQYGGENSIQFGSKENSDAEVIVNFIKEKIEEVKNAPVGGVVNQVSPAEELKKFKELLDMGVISQEEFDAKKKQILGL